jgi:ubiquinone/menaquinone biosynthesis C-methylase UbiE
VQKLEDPERLVWLPPAEVVAHLDLHPGMTVADIGAGTGYFALPLADAVAPGGAVKAVDFQVEMLGFLRAKLDSGSGSGAVELIEGSAARTTLPDASCHVALLAQIWHELDDRSDVLAEAARILRPEGRIAILDWRTGVARPPGPPLEHRIPVETARAELEAAAFRNVRTCTVGPYCYLLIATRP